jgi:hypothetical protein
MSANWTIRLAIAVLAVAAIVVTADLVGVTAAVAGCGASGC